MGFDMLHVAPPCSAPDFIKESPLANENVSILQQEEEEEKEVEIDLHSSSLYNHYHLCNN